MLPQIIYLNGPSSSGKTSLAHALQDYLEAPYLHVGIDRLIGMMPKKINNWTGENATLGFSWKEEFDEDEERIYTLQMGPFAEKILKVHKDFVVMLAKTGHYVIVDDVSFGKEEIQLWQDALKEFNVVWIGVTCDLKTLKTRELQRQDRIVGSCKGQFHTVHRNASYDFVIDTTHTSVNESMHKILQFLSQRKL